jgi:hypothetical protein
MRGAYLKKTFFFLFSAGCIFLPSVGLGGEDGIAEVPLPVVRLDGIPRLGRWVALSGERTRSPSGPVIHWQWRQTAGPRLRLNAADMSESRAWIFLEHPGVYRFSFVAENKRGRGEERELSFAVPDEIPAGPLTEGFRLIGAGELVSFPGEGWQQVRGPKVEIAGGEFSVALAESERTARTTNFRPATPGLYLFEAERAGDIPERRGIFVPPARNGGAVGNRRPSVRLPKSYQAQAGTALILDGASVFDPDDPPDALSARWTTPDTTRGVQLTPLTGFRVSFQAARVGTYRVQLCVSDGRLESRWAETFVLVEEKSSASPLFGESPFDLAPMPETAWPPSAAEPLARRATLGLYESNLERAIRMFPARCGVMLMADEAVASSAGLAAIPLNCGIKDAPVTHLLNFIARQTNSVWRRDGEAVRLSRPDGWLDEEPLDAVILAADALFVRPDADDLLAPLRGLFSGALRREKTAVNLGPGRATVAASLPLSSARRLRELGELLRMPKNAGLPAWILETKTDALQAQLIQLTAERRVTRDWTRRRLDYLLRDLGEETGLAISCDMPAAAQGEALPRLSFKFQDAPLREVARQIAAAVPFSGCLREPPCGLWFFNGGRPYPTRELLRDLVVVRTYDLEPVLRQIAPLDGHAVVHEIRQRIFPETWKDPAVGAAFFPVGNHLAVIHGQDAQLQIRLFLCDLLVRGEQALGGAVIEPQP